MTKIETVVLKDIEVVEVDGEFETRYVNERKHPAFLTNAALKKGKQDGYIETSLFSELAKLSFLENTTDSDGNLDVGGLVNFDEDKILRVIYLGLIGANKKFEYSYDEFLEKYHEGLEDSLMLYANLISSLVSKDPNRFAKEFEKATDKTKKKD